MLKGTEQLKGQTKEAWTIQLALRIRRGQHTTDLVFCLVLMLRYCCDLSVKNPPPPGFLCVEHLVPCWWWCCLGRLWHL